MARIRNIKPSLFRHGELADLEFETRLPLRVAFMGLFCQADCEGRFRWKPRELKLDVLPFDDVDFEEVLNALASGGFVVYYEAEGKAYGLIPNFTEHQVFTSKEAARGSQLPGPPSPDQSAQSEDQRGGPGSDPGLTRDITGTPELGSRKKEGGKRASKPRAAAAPVSAAEPRKAARGPGRSAEPPPDEAPEGVCRTWMRLWLAENGTGYLPSPFCFTDGVRLGTALDADQVELLEPAMRAFQKDPKTRRQGLNEFCRVAAGLIAIEAGKRRKTVRDGPTFPPPPEDPVRPISAALPSWLLKTAGNVGVPVLDPEKEPNACPG